MFMTDAARQRVPKSRAPQSCAGPAAACRSSFRCGGAVGPGLLHIAAPSLSLPRTSSPVERAGPAKRNQTPIHSQAATQLGAACADICYGKRIVDQRGGQSSATRTAAARARAWVSRNQFGNVPYSWNIDSIVCCRRNWLTYTSCWFQTDVSQSEGKLRKQASRPRESTM